jgi:hypothetical protein
VTVLQGNEVRGFTGSGRKLAIEAFLVLVVLGVAFGLSRVVDQDTTAYEGPMVERSLAMQDNTDALRQGAWPAPVGVVTYQGPLVDRSLAMEEFYKGSTYEGPLVDRSLAMEEFYKGQEHFRPQTGR